MKPPAHQPDTGSLTGAIVTNLERRGGGGRATGYQNSDGLAAAPAKGAVIKGHPILRTGNRREGLGQDAVRGLLAAMQEGGPRAVARSLPVGYLHAAGRRPAGERGGLEAAISEEVLRGGAGGEAGQESKAAEGRFQGGGDVAYGGFEAER